MKTICLRSMPSRKWENGHGLSETEQRDVFVNVDYIISIKPVERKHPLTDKPEHGSEITVHQGGTCASYSCILSPEQVNSLATNQSVHTNKYPKS